MHAILMLESVKIFEVRLLRDFASEVIVFPLTTGIGTHVCGGGGIFLIGPLFCPSLSRRALRRLTDQLRPPERADPVGGRRSGVSAAQVYSPGTAPRHLTAPWLTCTPRHPCQPLPSTSGSGAPFSWSRRQEVWRGTALKTHHARARPRGSAWTALAGN